MGKIDLPKRILPGGTTPGVRDDPSQVRRLARQEQQAIAATTGAITNIAGIVSDLHFQAEQSRIRQETIDGKAKYQADMDQMMIDNGRSNDLEVLSTWPDRTREESNKILERLESENTYAGRTKKELRLWAKGEANRYFRNASLDSIQLIAANERKALPATLKFYSRDENRAGFEAHLDEMDTQLFPAEKEIQLTLFDKQVALNDVDRLMEFGDFDVAREYVDGNLGHIVDDEYKKDLQRHIDAGEAAQHRKNNEELRLRKEQTYSSMLSDVWDGVLTSEKAISAAVRQGFITAASGRTLRSEMLSKDRPTESDYESMANVEEALLDMRTGLKSVTEVLDVIALNSKGLSSVDGRGYVKEAFATKVSADSEWDREATTYIEDQILNVSSITGIKFGTGEQKTLVAQAKVKYAEAKRQAQRDKKPLRGEELLALAHKIVMPFREKIKPLMKGESIPAEIELERIRGKVTSDFFGIDRIAIGMAHTKEQVSQIRKPKSVQEFEDVFRNIPTEEGRRQYYKKWASEMYK